MLTNAYIHQHVPGEPGGTLLFAFHGTGGNEHQMIGLAREFMRGATIVAPRGDVSESGAARFFRRTGEGMYDMYDLERATEKMAAFVDAHVAATRPSLVAGIGYSNGANILASLLFARPHLFHSAVLMHPLIPFQPKIEGLLGSRVLITAGRRDPICPSGLTNRLDADLRAAGGDVTLVWHEGGHEVRPEEIDATRRFLTDTQARESDHV
jgi:phospholipase/carboxylesterase